MPNTAKELVLGDVYVKDESYRFGLNAFKVLGGSYSIGKYISQRLGRDIVEMNYNALISDDVKKELGELTFVTATDGNPVKGDDRVISGECGASTFGCVSEIMLNPEYKAIREQLKLDENSTALFFSTEGDTDKKNYLDIVWDGKYNSEI